MKILQMGHSQCGGIAAFFQINYMLGHVVEANKILLGIIDRYSCCVRKMKSALQECTRSAQVLPLLMRMTRLLHFTKLISYDFYDSISLKP